MARLSLLIFLGTPPTHWDWNVVDRKRAVEYFRQTTIGPANTPARNARGTEFPDIRLAMVKYGVSVWHRTSMTRSARRALVCRASAVVLPTRCPNAKLTSGLASHWIVGVGYEYAAYLVMDPLSKPSVDYVHRLSEAQLRKYAATNPGHPASTAAHDSIIVG